MAEYKIIVHCKGDRIDLMKKRAEEVFTGPDTTIQVEKIKRNQSRADRLSEAEDLASQAKEIAQDLATEMEEWYDNLPENFQNGDKGTRIEECKDALEEIVNSLEECDFSSIDFPGMYE